MHKLHKLSEDLQTQKFSRDAMLIGSMFSLLMSLVGLCLCVRFIRQQVDSMAFKTIQVHFHQLDLANRGLTEPCDDIAPMGDA